MEVECAVLLKTRIVVSHCGSRFFTVMLRGDIRGPCSEQNEAVVSAVQNPIQQGGQETKKARRKRQSNSLPLRESYLPGHMFS